MFVQYFHKLQCCSYAYEFIQDRKLEVMMQKRSIYCAGMYLENPKEYISLVKGEEDNFSEVYGFRYELRFGLSVHFYGPTRDLEVPTFRGILE